MSQKHPPHTAPEQLYPRPELHRSALEKEFELERIILFSDAVFAIAITLIVIDIKFPEIQKGLTGAALLHAFRPMIISFFVRSKYSAIAMTVMAVLLMSVTLLFPNNQKVIAFVCVLAVLFLAYSRRKALKHKPANIPA